MATGAAIVVLALVILALLVDRARSQAAWDRKEGYLLQRIQDPVRAVEAHDRRDRPEPRRKRVPAVALDDDKAVIDAIGGDDAGS